MIKMALMHFFLALSCLTSVKAHSAVYSRSRRRFESSLDQPFSQRKTSDVHAQIGSGQSVIIKWASAHYYNYYVSVVPAKYQSNFHGTEGTKHPLREYQSIIEDYVASAPDGANFASMNPRRHGVFYSPSLNDDSWYSPRCSNGICPKDLYAERVVEGDPAWISHADEPTGAMFLYNQSYIQEDARVEYDSEAYPWLRSVHKFVQPVNLHSDYDIIEVNITKKPGDGEHFLVHWFLDLGGSRTFYADVMDVYVHDDPVDEALRYGGSSGSYSFARLDHCQWGASSPGYRRAVTLQWSNDGVIW